jgi:hypothetical protein
MPQEPSDTEREIVRFFDEARAARALQEAQDDLVLSSIDDPAARKAARNILLLIRNPKKTIPPELFNP